MSKHISALAAAALIAGGISAAQAGVHYNVPGQPNQSWETNGVLLAQEMFGNGTTNSEQSSVETRIRMPFTQYVITTAAGAPVQDVFDVPANGRALVKFTLGGGAVFGDEINTTSISNSIGGTPATPDDGAFLRAYSGLATAGAIAGTYNMVTPVTLVPGNAPGAGQMGYEVIAGGTTLDNTVTIALYANADGDTLGSLQFGGFNVKNLTDQLAPGTARLAKMGVEYTAHPRPEIAAAAATCFDSDAPPVAFPGGTADAAACTAAVTAGGGVAPAVFTPAVVAQQTVGTDGTDTAPALTVFRSIEVLNLIHTTPLVPRINVGSSELRFTTGLGAAGDSDFVDVLTNRTVNLGTLSLRRTRLNAAGVVDQTGPYIVKKEAGENFDFQGDDKHRITLNGKFKAFRGTGSNVGLFTDAACSTSAATAGVTMTPVLAETTDTKLVFDVSGNTLALEGTYHLCGTVNNTVKIEETTICANWDVTWFNKRYIKPANLADKCFNPLQRNGCRVTLFNLPGSDNADSAFIRLTNTSNNISGAVRASVWAQDGTLLADNKDLLDNLAPHATHVFSNELNPGNPNVVSLETVLGLNPADYKGRARLVLVGAFPGCEAQGLIRTGNGPLINMTSTTNANSNDDALDTTGNRRGNTGR